jgi:hypothetical protein
MFATAVQKSLPPKNGQPSPNGRISLSSWSEEAFQVSLQTVRALSEHRLRRDPFIPSSASAPKAQSSPPLMQHAHRGRIRTRWQLDMQRRAHREGKTVEQLREEERLRGIKRRQNKRNGSQ